MCVKWDIGERVVKNVDAMQMLITFSDNRSLVWSQIEGKEPWCCHLLEEHPGEPPVLASVPPSLKWGDRVNHRLEPCLCSALCAYHVVCSDPGHGKGSMKC